MATQTLQFLGDGLEFLGPILILIGVTAGPILGALLGTLGGALSVRVGRGLQELARTEPPVVNIPEQAPVVVSSSSSSSTTTTTQVNPERV